MLLTYILSTLLLRYRSGYAFPIHATAPSNATILAVNCTSILALNDSNNTTTPTPRTLFSVLWSCILTVIICAWSSVHPNLPPRSGQRALLRRIKLMFWSIVAPELVLAWAVRQWAAAKEVVDIYNKHEEPQNGTREHGQREHGHFLIMGGYQLVSEGIKKLKRPYKPGWIATRADLDAYDEYERQMRRRQLGVLTLDRFKQLMEDPDFEFPTITAAEIKDRSKGDGLAKLIAILQTSWFIIQCIARGVQKLALTELELVTLAMASLNAITFVFWWNKPLGVQEPVNVYIPAEAAGDEVEADEADEEDEIEIKARDVIKNMLDVLGVAFMIIILPLEGPDLCLLAAFPVILPYILFFVVTWPVIFLFIHAILFLLWLIKTEKVEKCQPGDSAAIRVIQTLRRLRYNLTRSIRKYFGNKNGPLGAMADSEAAGFLDCSFIAAWLFFVPFNFCLLLLLLIVLSPLFTLSFIASFIFTAVFEIVTTNKVQHGATHVPTFYSPRTKSDHYSRMIVFAIFGVIFGGIHCIGWDFFFPTHYERAIWRYTSVVLTAVPLVAAPIDYLLENYKMDKGFAKIVRIVLHIFMTALLFAYAPARLSLIAQALALLRHQPPAAFISVDWTKYIPHLFN